MRPPPVAGDRAGGPASRFVAGRAPRGRVKEEITDTAFTRGGATALLNVPPTPTNRRRAQGSLTLPRGSAGRGGGLLLATQQELGQGGGVQARLELVVGERGGREGEPVRALQQLVAQEDEAQALDRLDPPVQVVLLP